MIKNIISCTLVALATITGVKAQVRALPLLHQEQDLGAAAMASVVSLHSHTASIYSLSTIPLYEKVDRAVGVHAGLGFYPSAESAGAKLFSASLAYRVNKHAFMLGTRYLGLPEANYTDLLGQNRGTITPRDFTIDLGYALKANEHLALYARATYLQSYNSLTADVFAFAVGASYVGQLSNGTYLLSAGLDNLGPKYKYGKGGDSQTMPARIGLGLSYSMLAREQLTLGVRATHYLTSVLTKKTVLGAGLQWEAVRNLYLRTGYTWHGENSLCHLGLGYEWKSWGLNFAYDVHRDKAFNCLRLGLSYTFNMGGL